MSDVLAEVFKRGGMKRAVRRAEAVLLWPQVVGPEVARFTQARALQDGVLYVEVTDSETSMHLNLQRGRFLNVYRAKFGVKEVAEIRFRVGYRPSPPPPPAPAPPEPVDPKALGSLARDIGSLDLPEGLAGRAMQAAKAMLVHRARLAAQGYTPCPLCGALCEGDGICDTCRRYAGEPRVRAVSRRLAFDPDEPTPTLSDDERAVARQLARDYLDEALLELLPQVLADPAMAPQLEHAARSSLALELDKPLSEVDDQDFLRLDVRVARALGRWG